MKDATHTIAALSKMNNVDHRWFPRTGTARAESIQRETRS